MSASRYERLVKIAAGGTATVYVARRRGDMDQRELFALKRTHPHLRSDPEIRRLMSREANVASRVSHRNAVSIHDVEEVDDELLLVMEYVAGGSLSELLEAGAKPARSVLERILRDACEGLSAVHAMTDDDGNHLGFVHRDISPQNILVGTDGVSRITDFGLAKLTEVSMSRTEVMRGKVAYMAPEYLAGGKYTQRCDVFAMAVVIWETLMGQRLFLGAHEVETIQRIAKHTAPPLTAASSELSRCVATALSKDPAARPPSVAALVAAFDGAASDDEVARVVRERFRDKLEERAEALAEMASPKPTAPGLLGDDVDLLAEDFQLDSLGDD